MTLYDVIFSAAFDIKKIQRFSRKFN